MSKNKTSLDSRQWNLYNYLKTCYEEDSSRWVTPREIFENVDGYEWNEFAYDHCTGIRNDKKFINSVDETDKLIVMKNRCFKIGTKEEVLEERASHIRRLLMQKFEIENFDRKYGLNGQFKLLDNRGNEITEDSKAKPYRETFDDIHEVDIAG